MNSAKNHSIKTEFTVKEMEMLLEALVYGKADFSTLDTAKGRGEGLV